MSVIKAAISFLVLSWACILQAQPYAYITNQGSDSVSVIDTHSNKVIKTIKVGSKPAGVVVSNDSKRVYISNPESHDVSVIDTESLSVIKTVI
ncbi:MAG: YVTN family beta-propeller protein, partial [Gammaproteobacteria bacterium]